MRFITIIVTVCAVVPLAGCPPPPSQPPGSPQELPKPVAKPAPVIALPPPVVKPEAEKPVAVAVEKPVLSPPAGDGPAFTYYLGFAHRGNGEAMLKVAESYETGRGTAQNSVWACGWYERAGRLGISGARARKDALLSKLQPRELKQCQDWADGQSAPSG